MSDKFEIGDRVRLVKTSATQPEVREKIGSIGTIKSRHLQYGKQCAVLFDAEAYCMYFTPSDLERI